MDRRRRQFLASASVALGYLAGCSGPIDRSSSTSATGPTDTSTERRTDPMDTATEAVAATQTGTATLTAAVEPTVTQHLEAAVADGVFPGAVVGILDGSASRYRRAVGKAQEIPTERQMTADTVFDLASMSKAVATTTAVVQLIDRGTLSLETTLRDLYSTVPEAKAEITVHHLLTHSSGLPAWQPLWKHVETPDDAVSHIRREVSLTARPGNRERYSDLGFILLGDVVEQATGTPLDEYVAANIFDPLGMDATAYNPRQNLPDDHSYAATERSAYYGDEVVVGQVHDENAAFLGGVAGHAGLFSTVDDLSTFATVLLSGGAVDGTRILSERSVERMTKNQVPDLGGGRGLGWERRHIFGSVGTGYFDEDTFGQNGFTGTSLWVAPTREIAVVTLTNRVHPTRENNKILDFRPRFHRFLASLLAS